MYTVILLYRDRAAQQYTAAGHIQLNCSGHCTWKERGWVDCVYSYLSVLETSKKMTLPSFFTKRLHVEKVIKFTKNRLYNCFSCLLAAYLNAQLLFIFAKLYKQENKNGQKNVGC